MCKTKLRVKVLLKIYRFESKEKKTKKCQQIVCNIFSLYTIIDFTFCVFFLNSSLFFMPLPILFIYLLLLVFAVNVFCLFFPHIPLFRCCIIIFAFFAIESATQIVFLTLSAAFSIYHHCNTQYTYFPFSYPVTNIPCFIKFSFSQIFFFNSTFVFCCVVYY